LKHVAFELLTKVEGQDGSPSDTDKDFKFQKPELYDMDQDFDKKKKKKDEAVAEMDGDNLDPDQVDAFADLFEKDELASKSVS
jgi:hypothetical protein